MGGEPGDASLASDVLTDVQQAMVEAGGVQCGFCTPGFVVAIHEGQAEGHVGDDDGGEAQGDLRQREEDEERDPDHDLRRYDGHIEEALERRSSS